ncbi:MucR family transcriptional regulator [Aquamicrobium sp. NLF2-7]|uniref:MucR family transcriptional regulator n=1 Tax=Aquamicrobium sp. NLF2-7 TaxID=2918753 RepID=UPI001EFB4A6D|nr:MucR family transcriptional regulator [Aquamicrobium sp. NLF2-7]MCG8273892.1 MucR family transcriptional regulator [Aquamicrobium sp. NLF2-7]
MTEEHPHAAKIVGLTAEIVAAYISNNAVPMGQLPDLIAETYSAIVKALAASRPVQPEAKPVPAVPVRKSITPDFLICLEDGRKFKSLKRHLATHHDLTPEQYREKWKLPVDYPMVAPNYSAARSALAKSAGLGRRPPAEQPTTAPKRPTIKLKFS